MSWIDRLDAKFGRYAVPNLTVFLIAGQVLTYLASAAPAPLGAGVFENIMFMPDKVFAGEWWRLVTFLFTPPTSNLLFAFFFWYLFYLMGTTLEANWGTFRYNIYLLLGYVASVAMAFVAWSAGGAAGQIASNAFLYGTVFLAFARLYPEFTMYIFFVLPVKIRWLALLHVDHVRRDAVVFAVVVGAVDGRGGRVQLPGVLRPRHRPRHEAPPSQDAVSVTKPAGRQAKRWQDGPRLPRLRTLERRIVEDSVPLLLGVRRRLLLLPGAHQQSRARKGGGAEPVRAEANAGIAS